MKNKFNSKPIILNIPDSEILRKSGFSRNPTAILRSIPDELVIEGIEVIQQAIKLAELCRIYDQKRSKISVTHTISVREEWKASVKREREERLRKEEIKAESDRYKKLSNKEKRFFRQFGMTEAEYMDNFLKMAREAFEKR